MLAVTCPSRQGLDRSVEQGKGLHVPHRVPHEACAAACIRWQGRAVDSVTGSFEHR
jgi:hypothetical protein